MLEYRDFICAHIEQRLEGLKPQTAQTQVGCYFKGEFRCESVHSPVVLCFEDAVSWENTVQNLIQHSLNSERTAN